MNFHLQSRKRRTTGRTRLALVLFFLMVFGLFIGNYFTQGAVSSFARTALVSVRQAATPGEAVVASAQQALVTKQSLINQQEALHARIMELELYALNNLVLSSENKELRALLGGATTTPRGVLGTVLTNGSAYPYGTMVVSHENSDVVRTGALVFGVGNVLIGTVIESDATTALVRLLSAPDSEASVLIGADDRLTAAVLQGVGNGNMTAEVVRDADIQVGDPVVYLTQDTAIIGQVGTIETKPADAFQLIRVRTPFNLSTVRFVHIR